MPIFQNEHNPNKTFSLTREVFAWLFCTVLCVLLLPAAPFYHPHVGLDDSWRRALNLAVKNHLVFGRDFIFTFGPLGFLETRDNQYINNIWFILSDLFLSIGFFWLFLKHLCRGSYWWWPIIFISALFLKDVNFSQKLFLLFIAFSGNSIRQNFTNHFELIYLAIVSALFFYIKLSYGTASFALTALLIACSFFKNKKGFTLLLAGYLITFALTALLTKVALVAYFKNTLQIVSYFSDAMGINDDFFGIYIFLAFKLTLLFALLFIVFTIQKIRSKQFISLQMLIVGILCYAFFFFYKAGFTRVDAFHFVYYFETMPIFWVTSVFLLNQDRYWYSKLLGIAAIWLSFTIILWKIDMGLTTKITVNSALEYVSPVGYFSNLSQKFIETEKDLINARLNSDTLKMIGNSTVDIIPIDISTVALNNLNYSPRPDPQSYQAYNKVLDSINADHFYKDGRPEFVFIGNQAIDKRHPIWDESITLATIKLNYQYNGEVLNYINHYLLLKNRHQPRIYPQFEWIKDTVINLGEKIVINFPDSTPVYMASTVKHSLSGKLTKLFYNTPTLDITLYFEDTTSDHYKAIPAIMQEPLLISRAIVTNDDFAHFFSGDLNKNKRVTGFSFSNSPGFEQKVKVSFYRFVNYYR